MQFNKLSQAQSWSIPGGSGISMRRRCTSQNSLLAWRRSGMAHPRSRQVHCHFGSGVLRQSPYSCVTAVVQGLYEPALRSGTLNKYNLRVFSNELCSKPINNVQQMMSMNARQQCRGILVEGMASFSWERSLSALVSLSFSSRLESHWYAKRKNGSQHQQTCMYAAFVPLAFTS